MASECAEQQPDASASLMSESNEKRLALPRMVLRLLLVPLQLLALAPRDRARHQMWQKMARPTSRRLEVLMSDKALPLDALPMRVMTLRAGRPPGAHHRAMTPGVRTRSDTTDCCEDQPKPMTQHG